MNAWVSLSVASVALGARAISVGAMLWWQSRSRDEAWTMFV